MVRELKNAESDTKAAHILLQFNDRFDEVLSAISNTEKRLDTGAKCKYNGSVKGEYLTSGHRHLFSLIT